MPTINDLRQQAATIKNATQVGENTATRVGTTFETIADLLESMGGVANLSTIDIGSIDTLNTTGDMLVGTPNIYTLTMTRGSNTFKVGTLFQFANNGRYDVAQVIVSQYIIDSEGRIDTTSADQEVHIFYRLCKTMNGGSLPTPIGTWTTWTELGGSGGGGVTIDPYPTQSSGNAVSSGGVFERLQDVAPKVDISAIDNIDEYSDMLATKSPYYIVTKTISNNVFRIGTLMEFANQGRYILYQILATDYVLNEDGTLDTTLSQNGDLKLIWRMKQFSSNPPEGVIIGQWSKWSYFGGDNGYQPDNEDIDLNASDQLQFANKAYDASAFSGLGRVYLRKNIVELNLTDKYFDGFVDNVTSQGVSTTATPDAICFDTARKIFVARVGLNWFDSWQTVDEYNPITRDINWNYDGNFYRWNGKELAQWDKTINQLTQAIMNTANTIYHIQYDYDLNGQTITLPAGCVLEFDGGSVKNGTIVGNESSIVAEPSWIFDDVHFEGTWQIHDILPEWFGAIGYGMEVIDNSGYWIYKSEVTDSTSAIRAAIVMMYETKCTSLYLGKLYVITDEIQINSYEYLVGGTGFDLYGNGYNSGFFVSFSDNTKYALAINSTGNGYGVRNNIHDVAFYIIRTNQSAQGYSLKGVLSVREVLRSRYENILIQGGYNLTTTDGLFCFYAIENKNIFGLDIINCSGFNATANGIFFDSVTYAPALIDIVRCKLQNLAGVGIVQTTTHSAKATGFSGRIVGCELEGNTKGAIFMGPVGELVVESNYFELDTFSNLQKFDENIPACPWVFGVYDIDASGWKCFTSNLTFRNNHCGSANGSLTYAIICCATKNGSFTQNVLIENNILGSVNDKYDYITATANTSLYQSCLSIINNKFSLAPNITKRYEGLPVNLIEGLSMCYYSNYGREILYNAGVVYEKDYAGSLGEVTSYLGSSNNPTCFPMMYSTSYGATIKQGEVILHLGRMFLAKNGGKLNIPREGTFTQGSPVIYHGGSDWRYTALNGFKVGATIYSELIPDGTAEITEIDTTAKTFTINKNALRSGKGLLRTVGLVTIDRAFDYVGTLPNDSKRMNNDLNSIGSRMFNTANGKPCWWNGIKWIEGDGAAAGTLRSGATSSRPVAADIYVGFQFYDTTLGKPIYWNGTAWADATGTAV